MGKKREAIKRVEKADVEVSRSISGWKDSASVRALGWFGKLSDQPPLYALIGGLAAAAVIRGDARLLQSSARMLGAHWSGIRAKNVVKAAIDRTRPTMLIDEGRYESGKGRRDEKPFNSFPSGHTVGAVAIAQVIARDFPEHRLPAYALAALSAFARIAKCDHFVSDTAVGALIGWGAERASSRQSLRRSPA